MREHCKVHGKKCEYRKRQASARCQVLCPEIGIYRKQDKVTDPMELEIKR